MQHLHPLLLIHSEWPLQPVNCDHDFIQGVTGGNEKGVPEVVVAWAIDRTLLRRGNAQSALGFGEVIPPKMKEARLAEEVRPKMKGLKKSREKREAPRIERSGPGRFGIVAFKRQPSSIRRG
jgi:hypothetical protein